jgi:hypothetical protein
MNSPTLSELTTKPTISSDFQRTPANKKPLSRSIETAYEDRPSSREAHRKITKKSCLKCTFLQVHLLQQAISFASTAFNKKSLSRQNDHQKMSVFANEQTAHLSENC